MPLYLGPGSTDPNIPGGGPTDPDQPNIPPEFPVVPQPEYFKVSWTAPSGRTTDFSGKGQALKDWVTTPGVNGFDMPIFTPYEDTAPQVDGVFNRGFRTEPRDVSVAILMYAEDRDEFRQMRYDLFTDLNPRSGLPGLLTVTETDGTSRSLECFYRGGLEGAIDDQGQGMYWMLATIEWRAPSPFWLGETQVSGPVNNAETPWFPFPPLNPGGSRALGATTIDNGGQVDAQPIFTIHGPATGFTFQNLTTGEEIKVTYTLDGNDVVVVDTTDDNRSVILNGSVNLNPYMDRSTTKRTLWGLRPGINDVNLSVLGLDTGTYVNFSYQERYLAAW